MGYSHVAIVTPDLEASHRFYAEAMGFRLAKVDVAATPGEPGGRGWFRHAFYDTGDGSLLALWDLHDDTIEVRETAISTGLGLPDWVNHIAFSANDLADLELRRKRWLAHGLECVQIDHGWCVSIYTKDPSGNVVEFCALTSELGQSDEADAARRIADPTPEIDRREPAMEFFTPEG
jgi:catechol 2,3-dioxygenase-like lactoylglutathione lyase family enzyme